MTRRMRLLPGLGQLVACNDMSVVCTRWVCDSLDDRF